MNQNSNEGATTDQSAVRSSKQPVGREQDNNSNTNHGDAAPAAAAVSGEQQQQQQQQIQASSSYSSRPSPPQPPYPRQPRALQSRANLRRQIMVAGGEPNPGGGGGGGGSLELTGVVGAPTVPPKRPTRLPARFAPGLGIHGQPAAAEQKPNRYSWAQMQQWQQAAAAAAAAAAANKQQAPSASAGFHHHFSAPFSSAASRVLVVNPMQIVNLSEHTKSSLIKFIEAIKRFSEKWFSHVLLLMFLAVYACFGAYIFISFEAPTEHWEKQLIIDMRSSLVNESWHEAQTRARDQFADLFRSRLEDYERLLNRACASGISSSSLENQWTFWNALFYSMTVFTTIGYGHLTPITFAGRVATMVYALFGIPILLMVLADLGKLLTRIIKYAFKKFRYLFNKLLRRKSSLKTRKLISDNTHQYIGVARDAFERGFAYVQHQPAAQRVNSLKQKFFLRHQQQAAAAADIHQLMDPPSPSSAKSVLADEGQSPAASLARMEESTDVIVTPGKQTKPVSPPIGGEKKSLAEASSSAAHNHNHIHNHHHHHHHHHNYNHQNQNQHQHQQHRAQSPAFRIRRKVSTSGLMSARRHNQSAKSQALAKSASSNVVDASSPQDKQPAAAKRLSDANTDPSPAGEQTAPTANAAADQQRPRSHPNSTSEADATTDETIDVVAEFEMDEEEANENGDQEEEEEEEIEDDFDIPVSFALLLLVTYMMFGAVVFSIWEGWNFFDSLYFVFISMSTIGFGDLVPQHPKRMIGTFIYLLFGLALTSMCINVVQEKIHATFLRAKMQIGEKMGFDLDQIMADDYYDASLVYDTETGAELAADDANSLAASQTNSAAADHHNHNHNHNHHAHQPAPADEGGPPLMEPGRAGTSQSLDGAGHEQPPAGALKPSKSRESLRAKKRSLAGLPGHHGGASSISGLSLKRKPSKKMPRQNTLSSNSTSATVHLPVASSPEQVDATTSTTNRAASTGPQLAAPVGATDPMPVPSQIEVHRTTEAVTLDQQQPGINAPLSSVKSICEPLRCKIRAELCATDDAQQRRPKLIASRSLQPGRPPPTASYQTEPVGRRWPSGSPRPPTGSLRAGSEAPPSATGSGYAGLRRAPVKSSSYQGRSDLEAALSRRSSVSQELNQLDDLIVALGRSPSDKFGPLLGIPSSRRSSRSNSPSSGQLLAARRATSMTSRSPSRASQQAATKNMMVMPALNLSESQAALDELEAVKLSL